MVIRKVNHPWFYKGFAEKILRKCPGFGKPHWNGDDGHFFAMNFCADNVLEFLIGQGFVIANIQYYFLWEVLSFFNGQSDGIDNIITVHISAAMGCAGRI